MATPVKTVIEDEELIQYLHPNLLSLDYETYTVKFTVLLTSLLIFCILFFTSWLIVWPIKTFRDLTIKEKVFWNLAVVRAIYGAFASIIGAWRIFTYTNHYRDVVFGQTATGSFAVNVTLGFFLFECLAVTASDIIFGSFSRLLHVHHIFCAVSGAAIAFSEAGYSLITMSLSLEISTPFSAACWILLKAGMGRTKLWTINQLILLHTFHLRSVVECYIWWLSFKEWTVIWANMPWAPFITGYTALALFTFVATPYWAYKKTMQLANPTDWNFERYDKNHVQNGHAVKVD